jgi:hypothetical protein
MFMIPDSFMEQEGASLLIKIEDTKESIEKLETFFIKYKIYSYTNYETIPEWSKYLKLKQYLETLKTMAAQ